MSGITPDPRDLRIAELESRLAECRLTWAHEPDNDFLHAAEQLPLLREVSALAVGEADRPNLLIEGDNYHALLELSYTHRAAFSVIYIDPPYNTRSSSIGYNDKFDHSQWLSMMKPRLALARKLLAPGGFLAVSIDDHEMARLVLLLEDRDLFGEGSTKVVAVRSAEPTGNKMSQVKKRGTIAKLKEYVVFAKPGGVSGIMLDRAQKEELGRHYSFALDGLTHEMREEIRRLTHNGESATEEEVHQVEAILSTVRLISARDVMVAEGVIAPKKSGKQSDKEGERQRIADWRVKNAWRVARIASSESIRPLADIRRASCDQQLAVVLSKKEKKPYIIKTDYNLDAANSDVCVLFGDDYADEHIGDWWADLPTTGIASEGGVTLRNGKKPLALLRRIIKAHPNQNALVLDFFAGSGTTGEAVLALNAEDGGQRRFVLVTNNEPETDDTGKWLGRYIAHDITYPRLAGKFITGDRAEELRAVGPELAREAAVAGAKKLFAGGACGRYGASLRYFLCGGKNETEAFGVSADEARVRDRAAARVAELATDTLRVATDCYRSVGPTSREFELFESDERVLAVLHRYAARERLVEALLPIAAGREVVVYPSLPDSKPDERWFSERLPGCEVRVRQLPKPILDTYNNLLRSVRR